MGFLRVLSVIVVLSLCWSATEQSNILGLFPHFGYSHFRVYHPILRELAQRGHSVTVVTYIKSSRPHPNYEELLLSAEHTVDVVNVTEETPSRSLWALFQEFVGLYLEGEKSCEMFFKSGYVSEILKRHAEKPYDLVIMEVFNTDCYLGVPYLLQVPIIGLSSCALMPWHYARFALPDNPSYIQTEFIGFSEELNWQDRLKNFISTKGLNVLYRLTEWNDNKIIQNHLKIDVDVREFAKEMSLVFVNQHYSLSGNRPLSTQVKEIGGVHIDPDEIRMDLIPKEIESFLDASNETVLFISFGSMVKSSTIPKETFQEIVSALRELELRVIWRWDGEEAPKSDERFLFWKWVPQLALLCHPKVDLFWGHGGMLGLTEAVHCGKPLVVTPFYGDQFLNGYAVENRKIGKILHYPDITKQSVLEALAEVLKPRYSKRAQAVSKVFRTRESSPLSTAIWWIEHVLSGPMARELLRTKAVNLNWFSYYSLDSIVILLGSATFGFLLLFLLRWRRRGRMGKSNPLYRADASAAAINLFAVTH